MIDKFRENSHNRCFVQMKCVLIRSLSRIALWIKAFRQSSDFRLLFKRASLGELILS